MVLCKKTDDSLVNQETDSYLEERLATMEYLSSVALKIVQAYEKKKFKTVKDGDLLSRLGVLEKHYNIKDQGGLPLIDRLEYLVKY